MVAVAPMATGVAGIVPTPCGALLVTVTSNSWVAVSPPGSRAVIVTVAVPLAVPVTVTTLPDTDAPATRDGDTEAA